MTTMTTKKTTNTLAAVAKKEVTATMKMTAGWPYRQHQLMTPPLQHPPHHHMRPSIIPRRSTPVPVDRD